MNKLTLNSSEKEILDYLGLGVGRLEHLYFEAKKEDLRKIINYCSIKDLDFCLEDDFDIYFSDNFEKVGTNTYFGFTVMKEKVEYKHYIEIWYNGINIAGVLDTFDNKNEALNMAKGLYTTNHDYQIMLLTEKRKPNGYIISIDCEEVD
jgi:hypothetical protein